jgi:leader peptidase (prepilin peptidase)/N-methyltransferase
LNVLADTMPYKARLRLPRCAHCDVQHRPVAWLATTGFLLARGRCSSCGVPFPLRRVWVELGTSLVYVFVYNRYGLTGHMLLVSVYMSLLILVTVTDLEHRLILNRVILPAIVLALVAGPFTPDLNWKTMLVGGLVGFGFFYAVALLYPGGMGAGDVKLAAFVGLITGFPVVIVALLVTILAGGLISLLLVVTRIRSMRDAIPYGPFLVIGGVFALFWGQPVVDDYLERFQEARTVQTALARADLGMLAVDSDLGQSSIGYAWLREIGDYESIESS